MPETPPRRPAAYPLPNSAEPEELHRTFRLWADLLERNQSQPAAPQGIGATGHTVGSFAGGGSSAGPKGDKGDTGLTGPAGADGADGAPGAGQGSIVTPEEASSSGTLYTQLRELAFVIDMAFNILLGYGLEPLMERLHFFEPLTLLDGTSVTIS